MLALFFTMTMLVTKGDASNVGVNVNSGNSDEIDDVDANTLVSWGNNSATLAGLKSQFPRRKKNTRQLNKKMERFVESLISKIRDISSIVNFKW